MLALLLSLVLFQQCASIRILESEIRLDDDRAGIAYSGALLVREGKDAQVGALTICTRFNLKVLGGQERFTNLWMISDPRPQLKVWLIITF